MEFGGRCGSGAMIAGASEGNARRHGRAPAARGLSLVPIAMSAGLFGDA